MYDVGKKIIAVMSDHTDEGFVFRDAICNFINSTGRKSIPYGTQDQDDDFGKNTEEVCKRIFLGISNRPNCPDSAILLDRAGLGPVTTANACGVMAVPFWHPKQERELAKMNPRIICLPISGINENGFWQDLLSTEYLISLVDIWLNLVTLTDKKYLLRQRNNMEIHFRAHQKLRSFVKNGIF